MALQPAFIISLGPTGTSEMFSHFGTTMFFSLLLPFIQNILKCSKEGTEIDCKGEGGLEVAFLPKVLVISMSSLPCWHLASSGWWR